MNKQIHLRKIRKEISTAQEFDREARRAWPPGRGEGVAGGCGRPSHDYRIADRAPGRAGAGAGAGGVGGRSGGWKR